MCVSNVCACVGEGESSCKEDVGGVFTDHKRQAARRAERGT